MFSLFYYYYFQQIIYNSFICHIFRSKGWMMLIFCTQIPENKKPGITKLFGWVSSSWSRQANLDLGKPSRGRAKLFDQFNYFEDGPIRKIQMMDLILLSVGLCDCFSGLMKNIFKTCSKYLFQLSIISSKFAGVQSHLIFLYLYYSNMHITRCNS